MSTGADCKSQAVAAENGRRDCPGSLIKDRSPEAWTMTFPVHYNTAEAEKVGVTCHQKSHSLYGEGIEEVVSPYGCGVLCYSREVTLCDVLRPNNPVEIQQVMDAVRAYAKLPDRNLSELMLKAKQLRVEKRMRAYMEVLIWCAKQSSIATCEMKGVRAD